MIPPPDDVTQTIPVLAKLTESYKTWHIIHGTLPRLSRFSLGSRIDGLFVSLIEQLLLARYAKLEQKHPLLTKASTTVDLLKFLLRVAWELKCITSKQFASISGPIHEIGRMIGGWQKDVEKKQPSS